ncbi:DUF938 domain-containing protein [Spongiibacter sp. KMU-158]|uniref:DUF938 domain-containing protein n=1 Tax=Spongiibacter pelagi TaxID=2760804 RepID=A0A927BY11_9GAMM|nr:DUF938 domain-containing protein [Spongiibacter pelagi]MBD2857640.1 DUF938 domain-containing protein [Spongiibacter pelagi]
MTMFEKPFSQACENNKQPILDVIRPLFQGSKSILEIGSGTGQHAVFFAEAMPHLQWQCADQAEYLAGIQQWLDDASLANISAPQTFEVNSSAWPSGNFDGVFSANTLHIMSWASVQVLFQRLGENMPEDSLLAIYGPFNYQGKFTSDSNAQFDQWLKSRDPQSGIRDFEAVCEQAETAGYSLLNDHAMPANNRLLCWHKKTRR